MRRFGPVLPRMAWPEALRVVCGIGSGLAAAQLGLWALAGGDLLAHPLLIAPFGATAVLVYAVPASPLAQPWSAVVGNTLSAAVALAVLSLPLWPVATLCLAAALAVGAMGLARALHPPGGAVAVATVLSAQAGHALGPGYLFGTVALGTLLLTLWGMGYNRLTGRAYPFTTTAAPVASPLALAAALDRLRLAEQLTPDELSALIEMTGRFEAQLRLPEVGAMMTPNPVVLHPDDSLPHIRATFRAHGHRVLPVVGAGFQGFVTLTDVLDASPDLTARDLAQPVVSVAPEARLADLLPILARGTQAALPVVPADLLVGIATRSDLLAALLHAKP